MTDINHEEMAAGAEEIWQAWKDFERRLLTLVEAMRHPQDRLVLEVGASEEVPTSDEHRSARGKPVSSNPVHQ